MQLLSCISASSTALISYLSQCFSPRRGRSRGWMHEWTKLNMFQSDTEKPTERKNNILGKPALNVIKKIMLSINKMNFQVSIVWHIRMCMILLPTKDSNSAGRGFIPPLWTPREHLASDCVFYRKLDSHLVSPPQTLKQHENLISVGYQSSIFDTFCVY